VETNINLIEENDKQVKRYGERLTRLLRLNNQNIAIDTPTRVAKGSATLIDNSFTSQNKDFFSACNKDLGLSDHFSQFIYTRVQQERLLKARKDKTFIQKGSYRLKYYFVQIFLFFYTTSPTCMES